MDLLLRYLSVEPTEAVGGGQTFTVAQEAVSTRKPYSPYWSGQTWAKDPVAFGWLYPTIRLFHDNLSAKVPPEGHRVVPWYHFRRYKKPAATGHDAFLNQARESPFNKPKADTSRLREFVNVMGKWGKILSRH
jgi:hypothetical protein